uniref:Uncharacterized protein n=1 Tax=Noctiluca scintillans TaxID=2966 RepID=A0A7S1A4X5_NOCSC|mmetsp:Transcript_31701/g.84641  ORF Transcript_31701/g.84641 Transcript_31701/m.84641 type:complete len:166 (+) Transcript_31701:57-554(+)
MQLRLFACACTVLSLAPVVSYRIRGEGVDEDDALEEEEEELVRSPADVEPKGGSPRLQEMLEYMHETYDSGSDLEEPLDLLETLAVHRAELEAENPHHGNYGQHGHHGEYHHGNSVHRAPEKHTTGHGYYNAPYQPGQHKHYHYHAKTHTSNQKKKRGHGYFNVG